MEVGILNRVSEMIIRQGEPDTNVRILMIGLLGFLLSIKSDRYFPLPEHLDEPVFQLILLPYTLCFLLFVLIAIKPCIFQDTYGYFSRISPVRLVASIALVFEGMTFVLLIVQSIRYAPFGYQLNIPLMVFLFVAIGLTVAIIFFQNRSPALLFWVSLIAYGMTSVVSIMSFPLHPQRSDMLPLIVSGCKYALLGMTPYGFHDIPHHLLFTYLPGMWLAYVPAVALEADPRLVNLICIVASALILAYVTRDRRNTGFLLLSVFLLNPYLQYRHEIYLGVLFLVLSIVFALFLRSRWLAGSAVFGYALATYQFTWIIFPFALVSMFRRAGSAKTLISMAIAVGIACIVVLPFLLLSPSAFLEGVYGHWLYVDVPTVNLSYLVSLIVPWDYLIVVQGVVVLLILIMAVRIMDPQDVWGWMAGVLLLFIALNRVIEVYFYLLVLLLLVFHGIAVAGTEGGHDPGYDDKTAVRPGL